MRGMKRLVIMGAPGAQDGGAPVPATFTMVATTTADAQTVTINRLQAANAYEIDWGDGSAPQKVAAGYSGTLTHQYASAGTYNIVIPQAAGYTDIDIRDSKIGMTVTAANPFPSVTSFISLQNLPGLTWTVGTDTPFPSVTGYVILRNLSGLTWTVGTDTPFPSVTGYVTLYNLPGLTWAVSANTPFPSVTSSVHMYNLPGLTWTVSTDTPFPSITSYVTLYNLPGLTWAVSANTPFPSVTSSVDLRNLPGLTWVVSTDTPFPSVTTSVDLRNLPGLTWVVSTDTPFPSVTDYVSLRNLPGLTWAASADTPFPSVMSSVTLISLPGLTWGSGAAINLHSVDAITYESSLSQQAVDAVLADLYSVFPARTKAGTIDLLGGGNAAPSGTLQAACPPTTGKEYAYELVNDSCGVSDFHWTSVSIQA